jgi:thiol:disulfide interchange protein DsbC
MSSPSYRFRFHRVIAAAMLIVGASLSHAQSSSPVPAMSKPAAPTNGNAVGTAVLDANLKKTLETRMGATIDSIIRLPIGGIYEVRSGEDVFYTDVSGNYILIGNLIDLRTRENLTRTRVEEIKQSGLPVFKFAELPFDVAVKVVKGSGKRKVAIFEDPNCGYCKRLEKAIFDVGDVTVYVFLYPVLGPDSLVKSKQVWCSANRAKAWSDWMEKSTEPTGDGTCTTPLDKTLELGKKLRVDGTPTLFFSNNKRVEGAVDTKELEKLLAG